MKQLRHFFLITLVACQSSIDPKAAELREILRETVTTFKEAREKINTAHTPQEVFALMEDFTDKINRLAERKRLAVGPQVAIPRDRMRKLRVQMKPEVEAFQKELYLMRDTVISSRWNNEEMLKNPKFKALKAKLFAALKDLSRNDEMP